MSNLIIIKRDCPFKNSNTSSLSLTSNIFAMNTTELRTMRRGGMINRRILLSVDAVPREFVLQV